MTIRSILSIGAGAVLSGLLSTPVQAQSLGTFTWQLQPFCNKLVVTVTQNGAIYTLDGYDDQCGALQRAPMVGLGTPNPDGSIGFGLHIVTVPGGRAVQVDARISIATIGGPWADSAGNSGTLVLNGAAAGAARPAPTVSGSVIAVGSVPATAIANGAITTTQIANNTVTSANTSNEPGVNSSFVNATAAVTGATASYANVPMRVPADGYVKIEVTGQWNNSAAGSDVVFCQLQKGAVVAVDSTKPWFALRDRNTENSYTAFSAHRIVPVAVADNPLSILQGQNFRLVCELAAGAVSLYDVYISATYFASSYAPISLVVLPVTEPEPRQ